MLFAKYAKTCQGHPYSQTQRIDVGKSPFRYLAHGRVAMTLAQIVLTVYGHEADVDLKGDTSGSFKILCHLLLNKEPEDVIQDDDNLAEEKARRLWRVGQNDILYLTIKAPITTAVDHKY